MGIVDATIIFVKQQLEGAEAGHDWFHIERVYRNAMHIANQENCHREVVQLAALLHDIADSKFHGGDESIGPQTARTFLESQKVEEATIDHVVKIIENISFKKRKFNTHIFFVRTRYCARCRSVGCHWCDWNSPNIQLRWLQKPSLV
jgi:uncharacterized protein